MIHRSGTFLLVAPMIAGTLSGCGLLDAWKHRMGRHEATQTASNYGYSQGIQGVQPGHSTDADRFNENYVPFDEPAAAPPLEPPPVPPSRSNVPPLDADQPVSAQDAPLKQPAESHNLIKTLKTPRIFTPDGVRSIYDRIRGSDDGEGETDPQPAGGPIARNHILESDTQACRYTDEPDTASNPVHLGRPEVDGESPGLPQHPLQEWEDETPAVMQAGPSSFKHPLLADPTGIPYRTR